MQKHVVLSQMNFSKVANKNIKNFQIKSNEIRWYFNIRNINFLLHEKMLYCFI